MELWLHGARDPQVQVPLAERYRRVRAQLADGLDAWSDAAGHALPVPAEELAALILALLIGGAVQQRLEPAAVPPTTIVRAARRLVGLPDPSDLPSDAGQNGRVIPLHRKKGTPQ